MASGVPQRSMLGPFFVSYIINFVIWKEAGAVFLVAACASVGEAYLTKVKKV